MFWNLDLKLFLNNNKLLLKIKHSFSTKNPFELIIPYKDNAEQHVYNTYD